MSRLLVQTQLSNYDAKGKFILECDSGWQMVVGRIREMLKLNPDLKIDVMGPIVYKDFEESQVITPPHEINRDLDWSYHYAYIDPTKEKRTRLNYIQHPIMPNALATRYDMDMKMLPKVIGIQHHKQHPQLKYDAVYINDPMHLRNFKAMFHMYAGYQPKFYVHSHFIDDPSCPKFPTDASLWLGQCEASIKADYNFWQCQSSLDIFQREMLKTFMPGVVENVMKKSAPWDDGYSVSEVSLPVLEENLRFNPKDVLKRLDGKVVLFVPNRIGGRGRSSDYTNCGKFMFEILPELRKRRQDFVVIAGNPSQKFTNKELEAECGHNGYINLVPDAFNRDEFRWIASHSHIAVGLYDQDSYGGTAARECIELGCVPLWIDNYEYSTIAKMANWPYVSQPGFGSEFNMMADALIELVKAGKHFGWLSKLQEVVRKRCSYELTTPAAMKIMGLL